MIAVLADDAEVCQSAVVLVEQVENRLQGAGLQKFLAVVRASDQLQLGRVLAQEPLDVFAMVLHLGLQEIEQSLAGEPAVVQVDAPADQQQRHEGAQNGKPHEPPEQSGISSLALGGEVRPLKGFGSVLDDVRLLHHDIRCILSVIG